MALWAGWAYSQGPRPLSHTPWGELLVVLFFGIVAVVGSHYLHAELFSPTAFWLGLALGAPAAAVLLVNNVRDRKEDRRCGRHTLAIRLGRRRAAYFYLALMLTPYIVLVASGQGGLFLAVVPALPISVWLAYRFKHLTDQKLNTHLAHTAQVQLLLGALLCVGLLL